MNPAAILALIAELYEQNRALTEENQRLKQPEPQPGS
jgi:hypothetical protein